MFEKFTKWEMLFFDTEDRDDETQGHSSFNIYTNLVRSSDSADQINVTN